MKRQTFSETIGRSAAAHNSPMGVVKEVSRKKELTERDVYVLLKVCEWRLANVHQKPKLADAIAKVAAKL